MPETVSITKEATFEVKVYSVECSEAGHGTLPFTIETDRDGDLMLTVEPCQTCLEDAEKRGAADA